MVRYNMIYYSYPDIVYYVILEYIAVYYNILESINLKALQGMPHGVDLASLLGLDFRSASAQKGQLLLLLGSFGILLTKALHEASTNQHLPLCLHQASTNQPMQLLAFRYVPESGVGTVKSSLFAFERI